MPASFQNHRLRIHVRGASGAVVLGLQGELDAGSTSRLEHELTRLRVPCRLLVLDLHELNFVDSLGLNMLFRLREWAESHAVPVRVVRAPVHVQRLIALAAMDGTFGPSYADVDTALRA
jgi:anti-anti-sigma factor